VKRWGRYVEARDDSAASVQMPLVTLGGIANVSNVRSPSEGSCEADMPKRQLCRQHRKSFGCPGPKAYDKSVAMVVN